MDDHAFLLSEQSSLVVLLRYYCTRFHRLESTFIAKVEGLRSVHYLAPLVREYLAVYSRTVNFQPFTLKLLLKIVARQLEGDSNASYLLTLVSRKEKTTIFPKQHPQLLVLYASHYDLLREDWELSRVITLSAPTATAERFRDMGLLLNGRILYKHETNQIVYYSTDGFYDLSGFPVAVADQDSLSVF